jgi:hypothetical protein
LKYVKVAGGNSYCAGKFSFSIPQKKEAQTYTFTAQYSPTAYLGNPDNIESGTVTITAKKAKAPKKASTASTSNGAVEGPVQ